jgi:CheY-like chemotaxis protein
MSEIAGKRILVVEDEAIVAAMLEDMLIDLGASVVGPALTIAKAWSLLASEEIDAAVLDVNVRGERIDAVADALRARGLPIVFATGYGEAAADTARQAPIIDKPYTQAKLGDALVAALKGSP